PEASCGNFARLEARNRYGKSPTSLLHRGIGSIRSPVLYLITASALVEFESRGANDDRIDGGQDLNGRLRLRVSKTASQHLSFCGVGIALADAVAAVLQELANVAQQMRHAGKRCVRSAKAPN
ncbi:MAG: hypothetical protein ACJ8KA_02085, partial [Sulfurifustis sp.]